MTRQLTDDERFVVLEVVHRATNDAFDATLALIGVDRAKVGGLQLSDERIDGFLALVEEVL